METKYLLIAAAILFVLSSLCMRNTHPYSGSRSEKFESKQERRRVGIVLLVIAMLLIGVAVLTHLLVMKG